MVNGVDINTGLYPVLNYKPANAQYPYIYVPVAEFSKVGAKVTWNEAKQLLSVTTDYYENQRIIADLKAKISTLEKMPPFNFILTVTKIVGNLSEEQKMETNGLAETKTLDELRTMSSDAFNQLNETAVSKDGIIDARGGYTGFTMAFVKGDIKLVASVTFYTNDPNLSENYNKYTEQQKEIFNKFSSAAVYVANKFLKEQILAL